jgi:hypothetical protein
MLAGELLHSLLRHHHCQSSVSQWGQDEPQVHNSKEHDRPCHAQNRLSAGPSWQRQVQDPQLELLNLKEAYATRQVLHLASLSRVSEERVMQGIRAKRLETPHLKQALHLEVNLLLTTTLQTIATMNSHQLEPRGPRTIATLDRFLLLKRK